MLCTDKNQNKTTFLLMFDVFGCCARQLKLVPVLREWPAPSCPQVKARAFDSHVPCYLKPSPTAPSFCDLSFWDKMIIFKTVWTALGYEFYETVRGAFVVSRLVLLGGHGTERRSNSTRISSFVHGVTRKVYQLWWYPVLCICMYV